MEVRRGRNGETMLGIQHKSTQFFKNPTIFGQEKFA